MVKRKMGKKQNRKGERCIARNQIRKRLDKLIEGFTKFSQNHSEAHLYLKTEKRTDHGYMRFAVHINGAEYTGSPPGMSMRG